MKKSELVAALAEKAGLSKAEANRTLSALTDLIGNALAQGDKVSLTGFGTFSRKERAERTGVNPSTGAKIKIPAKKVAAWKASQSLSARLS